MKKKTNQSTMNKIVSGLIGGTILFLILNFIVKPLIEEKKVNKESISEKCGKININLSEKRILLRWFFRNVKKERNKKI